MYIHSGSSGLSNLSSSLLNDDLVEKGGSEFDVNRISKLFNMVNLGSIGIDDREFISSVSENLKFFIHVISKRLKEEIDLGSEDRAALQKLLKEYEQTLEIDNLINQWKLEGFKSGFISIKNHIVNEIKKNIFSEKVFYFITGFSNHVVMVKFVFDENKNEIYAEITNRGHFSDFHNFIVKDLARQVFSTVKLLPVSRGNFEQSDFLEHLLELNVDYLKLREDSHLNSNGENDYKGSDFYHLILPSWPRSEEEGKFQFLSHSLRGFQRGSTCALKPVLAPLRSEVTRATEKRVKLWLRMESISNFLSYGEKSRYSIHQIEWASAKMSKTCSDKELAITQEDKLAARGLIQTKNLVVSSLNRELASQAEKRTEGIFRPLIIDEKAITILKQCGVLQSLGSRLKREKRLEGVNLIISGNELALKLNDFADDLKSFYEEFPDSLLYLDEEISTLYSLIEMSIEQIRIHHPEKRKLFERAFAAIRGLSDESKRLQIHRQGKHFYFEYPDVKVDWNNIVTNPMVRKIYDTITDYLNRGLFLKSEDECQKYFEDLVAQQMGDGDENSRCETSTSDASQSGKDAASLYREFEEFYSWLQNIASRITKREFNPQKSRITEREIQELSLGGFYLMKVGYFFWDIPDIIWDKSSYQRLKVGAHILEIENLILKTDEVRGRFENFLVSKEADSLKVKKWSGDITPGCGLDEVINFGFQADSIHPLHTKYQKFFFPLIDDRALSSEENGRFLECYRRESDENSSLRKFIKIDKEEETFLSLATLYDELTLPMCIYYYMRYAHRLEDVVCSALIEAFIANQRMAKGGGLSIALSDHDNPLGDLLFEFLATSLEKIESSPLEQSKVTLLRFAALYYSNLVNEQPCEVVSERLGQVKNLLKSHINPVGKSDLLLMAITSLYPYVKEDEELRLCCEGAVNHIPSDQSLLLNQSISFQHDFDQTLRGLEDEALPSSRLPKYIYEDICHLIENRFPAVLLNERTYSFDDLGSPFRIVVEENKVFCLERELTRLDGTKEWFTYQKDPGDCQGYIGTAKLEKISDSNGHFFFCFRGEPELIIFSEKNLVDPWLYVKENKIIKGDNPDLFLVNDLKNTSHPLIEKLLALDNEQQIFVWKDVENTARLIEFPRYGFKLERLEDVIPQSWRFSHPDFEEMYLDLITPCQELEPYTHYLSLKNGQGKKMVIMPSKTFYSDGAKFQSEVLEEIEGTEDPKLLYFNQTSKGQLILSSEVEPTLYLLFLALHRKDYSRATTLIEHLSIHCEDWGDEVMDRVSSYFSISYYWGRDRHPYASVIRLKLIDLLERGGRQLTHTAESVKQDDQQNCREQKRHGFLNEIPNFEFDYSESDKYTFYKGKSADKRYIEARPGHLFTSESHFPRGSSFNRIRKIDQGPTEIALMTRPHRSLVENFVFDYEIAINGNPDAIRQLKRRLIYSSYKACEDIDQEGFLYILCGLVELGEEIKEIGFLTTEELQQEWGKRIWDKKLILSEDLLADQSSFKERVRQVLFSVEHHLWKKFEYSTDPVESDLFSYYSKYHPASSWVKEFSPSVERNDRGEIVRPQINSKRVIEKMRRSVNAPVTRSQILTLEDDVSPLKENIQPLLQVKGRLDERGKGQRQRELKELYQGISNSLPSDPLRRRSCGTTIQGIDAFYSSYSAEDLSVDCSVSDQGRVKEYFRDAIQHLSHSLKMCRESLMEKLNDYEVGLDGEFEDLIFQKEMGMFKPLTFREALLLFAKGDDREFLDSNPKLIYSLGEVKELIRAYLIYKTDIQHLKRSASLFTSAFEDDNLSVQERIFAKKKFYDHFVSDRGYALNDRHANAFMLFEVLGNFRLRKEQVDALAKTNTRSNIQLEAKTGFGKSQVIIPMWLILNVIENIGGDQLVVCVVPPSLLKEQEAFLKKVLGTAMSIGVYTLTFPREKIRDYSWLRKTYFELLEAQKKNRVVLMDINSLYGMTSLALKDALYSYTTNGRVSEDALEILFEMRKMVVSQSKIFIDESRECLNPRQRYEYAIGAPVSVDLETCTMMSNFWERIFFHAEIQKKWGFEFLAPSECAGKTMVKEENFNRFQRDLAAVLIKDMRVGATDEFNEAFISYLVGGERSHEVKEFLEHLDAEEKKYLAFNRGQIAIHLQKTVLKTCGERYDINEQLIATPQERGVMKPHSEFTALDDRLNFTMQANLKRAFDKDVIASFVQKIKAGSSISSVKNRFMNLFNDLREKLDLNELPFFGDRDLESIRSFLNGVGGEVFKARFIALWIFPSIRYVPNKFSETSFSLLSQLEHVQCASGTINPDILHPKIKSELDPKAPIGSLAAIFDPQSSLRMMPNNPREALRSLLQSYQGDELPPIIIDVAGTFLDLNEDEVLSLFFEENEAILAVSYYDEEGRSFIRKRGGDGSIPRERVSFNVKHVGVFIRQGKCVGSDLPMPLNGRGIITVNEETSESFFLQGVGRMRGLNDGQTVDVALSLADARLLTPGSISDLSWPSHDPELKKSLLRHLKTVEVQLQGIDNFFCLDLYLRALIEEKFWEASTVGELIDRFNIMKDDFLVIDSERDLLQNLDFFQNKWPSSEAVEKLKSSILGPLKKSALAPYLDDIEGRFRHYVDLRKLPATIEGTLEVEECVAEADQIVDQFIDQTADQMIDQSIHNAGVIEKLVGAEPASIIPWDGDYRAEFARESRSEFCGLSIYLSPNYDGLMRGGELPLHKAAYFYLLEVSETGKRKVMALDLYDTRQALKFMKENKGVRGSTTYLLLQNKVLNSNRRDFSSLSLPLESDEVARVTLAAKILAGDANLTIDHYRFLKTCSDRDLQDIKKLVDEYSVYWPSLRTCSESSIG